MTTASPLPLSRLPPRDEREKDLDCTGFVYRLPVEEQAPWMTWMQRVRLADRLAETDPEALRMLRAFDYEDEGPHVAKHWLGYLDALAKYHDGYVVKTVEEHDQMLGDLSGNILALAPGIPAHLLDAAYAFGALDQFYNNLRDMREDAERGMCWLPEEVLRGYGITREDVIYGRAPEMPRWRIFIRRWSRTRSAKLSADAKPFLRADLPQSLDMMRAWTLRRYARIAEAMRAVNCDCRRFPDVYWPEVKRELGKVEVEL